MKLKDLFRILIWPIIFIIGQFTIKYIFVAYYNYKNMSYYKTIFKGIDEIDIVNMEFYKYHLNKFLNSQALLIVLIIFLIFGYVFYAIYKKYKQNSRLTIKSIVRIIFTAIFISAFYNTFIYLINNSVHISDNYKINSLPIYIQVLSSGIIGPILEELLFRGVIYNRLKEIKNINKSKLYTSILFSLMHLPNIVLVIYTFLLSFIMIEIYERFKTLKASIIFHITINITSIIITYILIYNNILLNVILLIINLLFLFKTFTQKV